MGGSNVDLNPTHGSLFTGAGLPWGATQTPTAGDMPVVPRERSLEEFKSVDDSEMLKRLIANLRGAGAKQSQTALRQASRMGAAQSDAARAQLGNIAANVEDRALEAQLQAMKAAWEDKMRQKQFAEQMDINRYERQLAQWQQKKAANQAEEAKRNKGLTDFAALGASTLFGG